MRRSELSFNAYKKATPIYSAVLRNLNVRLDNSKTRILNNRFGEI